MYAIMHASMNTYHGGLLQPCCFFSIKSLTQESSKGRIITFVDHKGVYDLLLENIQKKQ
jgi:hypothetical protein